MIDRGNGRVFASPRWFHLPSDLFLGFHDRGAQNICKMSQHLLFGTKSSSEWARKTRQVKTKVDENQVWQHRFVSKTAFGPLQKISWRSEAALEVFVQLIFEDFCWNSLMHFLEVPGVSYFRREHRATPWGVRVVNNQMFQLDWLAFQFSYLVRLKIGFHKWCQLMYFLKWWWRICKMTIGDHDSW